MRLEDLDFDLPEGLVAQYPSSRRDESRLLAMDRAGDSRRHLFFRQVPGLLRRGDVLVLNQSRVVPARLRGRKARTGGRVQILLLGREGEAWLAMARPLRGLAPGDRIDLEGSEESLEVVERVEDRVRVRLPLPEGPGTDDDPTGFAALLPLMERAGEIPLPPYISTGQRATGRGAVPDRLRLRSRLHRRTHRRPALHRRAAEPHPLLGRRGGAPGPPRRPRDLRDHSRRRPAAPSPGGGVLPPAGRRLGGDQTGAGKPEAA